MALLLANYGYRRLTYMLFLRVYHVSFPGNNRRNVSQTRYVDRLPTRIIFSKIL